MVHLPFPTGAYRPRVTVLLPPAGLHPLTLHLGPVPSDVQAAVSALRGPDGRLPERAAHAALYAQVEADGGLVGFCLAEERNAEPGSSWAYHDAAGPELGALVVAPRWRGRGLGAALVGSVARAVAASGRTACAVTAPGSPAVAVNRRLGAVVAGTFRRGGEELWLWDFAGAGRVPGGATAAAPRGARG
ncbi:hypothetical protein GCM10009790_35340 [Georgenia ruanii]|uniref:GNAT family N-acetyltransferase n=1 Tax=Georgenia ruanii TaxID=348442 RepID=A0A7J9UYW1_9MICO|nr:GNAT family N-acetyltransferase [Georgenia ruanii]